MPSEPPQREKPDAVDPVAKYNAVYSSLQDFVQEPNAFLAACLDRIAAEGAASNRRAMDVGVGQGRNAVLLARRGYDTVGIDRSEVGIAAVQRGVAAQGIKLRVELADATIYDFGRDCWDLITLLYYPLPLLLIDRVKAAVRPGGHIVIERFTQTQERSDGPDAEEGRLPNPMLRWFEDWNVLHYEHDVLRSDWHWNGESPTGPMVRLLARKP